MPMRKIADPEDAPMWRFAKCSHPEHDPPKMMVYKPGAYEHECPACRKKTVFTVPARCSSGQYKRIPIPGDIGVERRFTVGAFVPHASGGGS